MYEGWDGNDVEGLTMSTRQAVNYHGAKTPISSMREKRNRRRGRSTESAQSSQLRPCGHAVVCRSLLLLLQHAVRSERERRSS